MVFIVFFCMRAIVSVWAWLCSALVSLAGVWLNIARLGMIPMKMYDIVYQKYMVLLFFMVFMVFFCAPLYMGVSLALLNLMRFV